MHVDLKQSFEVNSGVFIILLKNNNNKVNKNKILTFNVDIMDEEVWVFLFIKQYRGYRIRSSIHKMRIKY